MKLVELECENCGAALKIEEGSDTVNCPYCKASYKIDDEVKHVKYEDMENSGYEFEKGRIKAQKEHLNNNNNNINVNVDSKFSMVAIIPIIMVAIVMIVIIVTTTISRNNWNKNHNNNDNNSTASQEAAKRELESKIHDFNWKYSSGKKVGAFVESDLNNVINTNKTNKERYITVKFNGTETHDPEEILGIIDQLETHKDYNVLLDYDTDGFITTITIK